MRRFSLHAACVAMVATSSALAQDPGHRLVADWRVENRGTYCLAERTIEDEKGWQFSIRTRSTIGDNAAIYLEAIGGKGPKKPTTEPGDMELDGQTHMLDMLSWRFRDGRQVRRVILNDELANKFAASKHLSWRRSGLSRLEFDVSGYAAMGDAIARCKSAIEREWGLGLGEAGPRSNLAELFTTDDYPEVVLRRGGQGTVRARMFIDENGKIVRCNIVFSSGYVLFDQTVCQRLTERATFDPALTVDGRPRKSMYVQSVHFSVVR